MFFLCLDVTDEADEADDALPPFEDDADEIDEDEDEADEDEEDEDEDEEEEEEEDSQGISHHTAAKHQPSHLQTHQPSATGLQSQTSNTHGALQQQHATSVAPPGEEQGTHGNTTQKQVLDFDDDEEWEEDTSLLGDSGAEEVVNNILQRKPEPPKPAFSRGKGEILYLYNSLIPSFILMVISKLNMKYVLLCLH